MPNRLADETSPYLLQHRDNPVEWHPWDEEALALARREDRPILLSIGYSACHWCHVMERESFEDPEIAARMNRDFVNIKVDREERPDLDSIYMTAVQSMTGSGGWPLTVFLTPEGVPFYGGTYFPPTPRRGMPSFPQVMDAVIDAYRNRRPEIESTSEKLVDVLRRATVARAESESPDDPEADGRLDPSRIGDILADAGAHARSRFDEIHGGFGGAPKFPQAPFLDFLLRRSGTAAGGRERGPSPGSATGGKERDPSPGPAEIVARTLDGMARGGIRDHLGGGFHRYAVDAAWLVPHFEKMLYDNALLARLYLHHHLATGSEDSRRVAVETLDYLLEDLRAPEGGFYAARDADSEGEEGRFYVWDAEEVDEVLENDAELFRRAYGITPGGNWEGTNVLHLPRGLDELAEREGVPESELRERLSRARERLLARRSGRTPPLRDEKVLAGWNGLTIRALAEAGPALGRPDYTEAAKKAARFVLDEMRDGDRLLHVWTDGEARIPGFLEDYGAVGTALLALHEATLESRWLRKARWCCDRAVELFWDGQRGLFFDTPADGEPLVVRPRDATDNPSPSGTSLVVELLQRTAVLFDDPELRSILSPALGRDLETVRRHPSGFGSLLGCLDFHLRPPVEVAVVEGPDREETVRILQVVHSRYLPRRVVVGTDPGSGGGRAGDLRAEIPLLEGREIRDGRTTVYVCRNYACEAPVTEPEELDRLLERRASGG